MKLSLKILSIAVGIFALQSVYATVFVCQDAKGHKEYTSEKGENCEEESVGTLSTYTPAPITEEIPSSYHGYGMPDNAAQTSTQSNYNKLQTKLEEAQKNLEEGKKVRKAGEQNYARYQRRIRGLEAEVNQAQDALKKSSTYQTSPESASY